MASWDNVGFLPLDLQLKIYRYLSYSLMFYEARELAKAMIPHIQYYEAFIKYCHPEYQKQFEESPDERI